jgi:hypothetical protein
MLLGSITEGNAASIILILKHLGCSQGGLVIAFGLQSSALLAKWIRQSTQSLRASVPDAMLQQCLQHTCQDRRFALDGK